MNTFTTLEGAQAHAKSKGGTISIIQIEHKTEGLVFVCCRTNLAGFQRALEVKPMVEIKRLVDEFDPETLECQRVAQARLEKEVMDEFRDKHAEAIAKAIATGQPQVIDHWMETRRAKDGGEWGEYLFSVDQYIRADGTTFQKAINCY